MSIPQPQMLYTGLNVAVPDWKSFNQDFNARMDQIRREKQQQKQFDSQRQDQINREFLKTVDIDQINFADANLKQQAADIYKGFEGFATNIVEGKKGKMDFQDIMNAQAAAKRAEQEVTKIKAWDLNHQKDMMVASDPKLNKEIDLEKAKVDVFGYDGKTPYTESRLKIKEWTPEEFSDKLKAEYDDANKRTVIMTSAGLGDVKGNTSDELTVSFVEKLYDISKDPTGFTTLTLKKDKAIQEVKTMAMSQDYRQGQYGLLSAFDKLPQDEKDIYESLAKKETGRKEDAPYSWFVDKHMQEKYPRTITDRKEPSTTSGDGDRGGTGKDKRVPLDLRETTVGSMASEPVPITGTVNYFDKEGKEQSFNAGLNDIRLTKIYYDDNRSKWMVDGILKRGTTEQDLDEEGIMSRTINEPITMTYDSVKEDINRKYNVLLPTEVKKKKTTGIVGTKDTKL